MRTVRRSRVAGLATLAMLATVAVVPAAAQEGPPACPPAPAGAIVVTLPFEELYTNRGEAASIGSTVAADIPAGNYTIRFTVWDDHVIGDVIKDTQLREVLYLQGFSGGSVVFSSGDTPDLPDDQNTLTVNVNTNVAVPALDALRAVHADPEADETANSLHPICVAFVPVQQDTTTTVPETTTTQPETTTTTLPEETTTTTVPEATTTTTVPDGTTTTTVPTTPTTAPDVDPTTTVPATLPFTGVDSDHLAIVAFLALAAGTGLVLMTRQTSEALGDRAS